MLSIIIPLYNKQAVIARTIESILSQSYINWELIIVDDGSTDGSDEVVRLYLGDQRIRYIRKPNGGVSSARNRGIKEAKGEWICYIDADDYFLPEGLKTMVELAEKYNVKVAAGRFLIEIKKKRFPGVNGKREGALEDNFKEWFFNRVIPRAGVAVFHAELLKNHLFDETLSRYEDAKSLFEILRENRMAYTPIDVMTYSLDNLGLSGKVADFSKDFIFSMNFDGKSYWEKMLLGDMLNQGLKLYPEYTQFLLNKYGNDLMWSNKAKRCNFMNRIIFIPRKLIMKLKFYLSGPLAG